VLQFEKDRGERMQGRTGRIEIFAKYLTVEVPIAAAELESPAGRRSGSFP